jgi:8-oxo-dGTP pyrophosphatase MutT (NUDIX family)
MHNRITRIGTYGILLQEHSLILTHKIKGPFKGLLDLPGGGIEFGEDVKSALSREIEEELGMHFSNMEWFENLSYHGEYLEKQETFAFHHIGLIYRIRNFKKIPSLEPQDSSVCLTLDAIDCTLLTPFAKAVVEKLLVK